MNVFLFACLRTFSDNFKQTIYMRIHLIAIGGAAMHNLAIALHINHHTVSGSDDEVYNPARDRLSAHGLLPQQMGWHPDKITPELDLVILGMHARKDNPELLKAQELGLPIFSYPEYLFHHAKDKQRICVAGSHGKTSTTAMILHVLNLLGLENDFMVGAQLEGFDTMVKLSDAPLFVVEGDEYLSSPIDRVPKFWHYRPHLAIITGVAWDHINVFPTFEEYVALFGMLIERMEPGGKLFAYQNDPHLDALLKNSDRKDIEVHRYAAFASRIKDGQTFLIDSKGKEHAISIFGQHNLENLQAAWLVCQSLGISEAEFISSIQSFAGAAKRLQLLKETPTQLAYLDFAHAPSKARATINALQAQFPDRQLIACFELHTFSSLNKNFLQEYRHTMAAADRAFVYFSEHTLKMKKLEPISKVEVAAAFDHPNLSVFTDIKALEHAIQQEDFTNTNLLMMSSGRFDGLDLKNLVEALFKNELFKQN